MITIPPAILGGTPGRSSRFWEDAIVAGLPVDAERTLLASLAKPEVDGKVAEELSVLVDIVTGVPVHLVGWPPNPNPADQPSDLEA